jgi:hypothetical protein
MPNASPYATLSLAAEARWQHMATCSVCTPRAWVLELPLCSDGEEIRQKFAALLKSLEPPGCPCGGTGTVVAHDAHGVSYRWPCVNFWCVGCAKAR